jgi:hypothetical protein
LLLLKVVCFAVHLQLPKPMRKVLQQPSMTAVTRLVWSRLSAQLQQLQQAGA